MAALAERLTALGLVKPERLDDLARAPASLLALCDDGWLLGGLSVALDVRPDEALGPLLQALGGEAPRLRVLDVRDDDGVALTVRRPGSNEDESWQVDRGSRGVAGLLERLNEAFEGSPRTGVGIVLGEWNDALQLWCVPRKTQEALVRAGIVPLRAG